MENIKLCIFDLDGTLTDTLRAIAHFANIALAEYGMGPLPVEDFKTYVGDGRATLIHRILTVCGNDTPDMFVKVRDLYDANYEKDYLYDTNVYDGMKETLAALKDRGYKLGVCSNKPDNVARFVIDTMFDKGLFDEVHGVIDGMPVKPDPYTALEIAKKLGVKPCDCMFLGDTNVDIRTAKNAGMTSVGVLWGFRTRKELEDAGADYIIEKPSDILDLVGGKI